MNKVNAINDDLKGVIDTSFEEGEKSGYEKGEKDGYEKGEKNGYDKGEKDGVERGKEEQNLSIARNLKQMGIEIEKISEGTGLSKDIINGL